MSAAQKYREVARNALYSFADITVETVNGNKYSGIVECVYPETGVDLKINDKDGLYVKFISYNYITHMYLNNTNEGKRDLKAIAEEAA